jgi:hypothetical protein
MEGCTEGSSDMLPQTSERYSDCVAFHNTLPSTAASLVPQELARAGTGEDKLLCCRSSDYVLQRRLSAKSSSVRYAGGL